MFKSLLKYPHPITYILLGFLCICLVECDCGPNNATKKPTNNNPSSTKQPPLPPDGGGDGTPPLVKKGPETEQKEKENQKTDEQGDQETPKPPCAITDEMIALAKDKGHDFLASQLEGLKNQVQGLAINQQEDNERPRETALHQAVKLGDQGIIQALLNAGAKPNVVDKYGATPLHEAVHQSNLAAVNLLLAAKGADVNAANRRGHTPLNNAVSEKKHAIIEALVAQGAKVLVKSGNLFDYAIRNNDPKSVEILLKAKDVDVNKPDDNGLRPLDHLIDPPSYLPTDNFSKVVEVLAVHDATEVNYPRASDGYTPLHRAVEKGDKALVEALLKSKNIIVDKPDKSGHTPLYYAAKARSPELVNALINEKSADEINNNHLLHQAAANVDLELVKSFLSVKGVEVNKKDANNKTPLVYAVENNDAKIVEALVNQGATIPKNLYLLHYAVEQGYEAIVKSLLRTNHVDAKELEGANSPIFYAVQGKYAGIIKDLIKKDPDVAKFEITIKKNNDQMTLLHQASFNNNVEVVEALLLSSYIKANIDKKATITGMTALHIVATYGYNEMVKTLLSHGANPGEENVNKKTPLYIAIENNNTDLALIFLNKSNKFTKDDLKLNQKAVCKNNNTYAPLHIAIQNKNLEIVKALVEKGADKECEGTQSGSLKKIKPLEIAKDSKDRAIVEYLLRQGAEFSSRGNLLVVLEPGSIQFDDLVKDLESQGAVLNKK